VCFYQGAVQGFGHELGSDLKFQMAGGAAMTFFGGLACEAGWI
jgi:hypothetical protein